MAALTRAAALWLRLESLVLLAGGLRVVFIIASTTALSLPRFIKRSLAVDRRLALVYPHCNGGSKLKASQTDRPPMLVRRVSDSVPAPIDRRVAARSVWRHPTRLQDGSEPAGLPNHPPRPSHAPSGSHDLHPAHPQVGGTQHIRYAQGVIRTTTSRSRSYITPWYAV